MCHAPCVIGVKAVVVWVLPLLHCSLFEQWRVSSRESAPVDHTVFAREGGWRSLGVASGDLALNAALVDAALDLEEAVGTPGLVPAVGDEPVGGVVLDAPAHDLDGMAAQLAAALVGVHALAVGEEVGVDGKGDGDGAVGHELRLHLGDAVDGVGGLGLVAVLGPGRGVRLFAAGLGVGAGGGWGDGLAAVLVGTLLVVVAVGQLVGWGGVGCLGRGEQAT